MTNNTKELGSLDLSSSTLEIEPRKERTVMRQSVEELSEGSIKLVDKKINLTITEKNISDGEPVGENFKNFYNVLWAEREKARREAEEKARREAEKAAAAAKEAAMEAEREAEEASREAEKAEEAAKEAEREAEREKAKALRARWDRARALRAPRDNAVARAKAARKEAEAARKKAEEAERVRRQKMDTMVEMQMNLSKANALARANRKEGDKVVVNFKNNDKEYTTEWEVHDQIGRAHV